MPKQTLKEMLESLNQLGSSENQPETLIYNEGWMLRLILQAAEEGYLPDYFPEKFKWFAEGQLRSPFGRKKGTSYEKNTHADGVVGDITTDDETKSAIELDSNAKHFCVYEAKMFSGLSRGTKNAPDYNQAARTIACMAHTLETAKQPPHKLKSIGFFVIAPQAQINKGMFDAAIDADSIREAVGNRISQFSVDAQVTFMNWQTEWFEPLLEKMVQDESLKCIAWEDLINELTQFKDEINKFYGLCLNYNSRQQDPPSTSLPDSGKFYKISEDKRKDQTVVVCFSGARRSRVYQPGKREKSFLVANECLTPVEVEEGMVVPHSPQVNWKYQYKDDKDDKDQAYTVKVLNTGPCNSRVIKVDNSQDETSFLVPNHFLEEIK
ncbi:hypothetical protein FYZ48_02440 [Gimesia chilikensis]|uniref:hypothetical protein n=1 Tax=Gimesia chilikensis TaxID=2605989 RepID=UPI0011EFBD38|nr:hypothetical protein [Gimesia chilikensis]KAA0142371.1 hypothetical protein FYZ48_02440 [Gimesia chilikensis]